MKELNSIKIIAIDHGYGNIKTANTVTPTGITAYDTEPIFMGNILEYNGRYYRIGDGHKEFVSDKWQGSFTGNSLHGQTYTLPQDFPSHGCAGRGRISGHIL